MFSITKKVKMKKLYCVVCDKYRKFENFLNFWEWRQRNI